MIRASWFHRQLLGWGWMLVVLPATSILLADTPPIGAIDDLLAHHKTLKAARLTERALEDAAPENDLELRYLLLKAHILDMQDSKGDLYRRAVGKGDDGMEAYEAIVEQLESDVRSAGGEALPLFISRLERGDALDRLLILGLFQEMLEGGSDLPWSTIAALTGVSPLQAAERATLVAAADCTLQESIEPPDPILEPESAHRERDAYLQVLYSLTSGLDFLSRVDPESAARVAAQAIPCRGAAGLLLEDRQQLERLGGHLPNPLRLLLAQSGSQGVQIDALMLLGRYGRCSDTDALRKFTGSDFKTVAAAAEAALRRVRMRLDCSD